MEAFRNPSLPIAERVANLLSRLSREEKIGQLKHASLAVERLGIPAYNWWAEGIHGVGRAGLATVFPQCVGMAASFDEALLQRIAEAIAAEARAKHEDFAAKGQRGTYKGLCFWAPNINLFRDPRWGRGQETYGEDPHLTTRLGLAFVRGLQGSDPGRPTVLATPKHFAVHSGPEAGRHGFDAKAGLKDLYESYLPAFRATVVEGRAGSVMAAYNALNGEPCSSNTWLLGDLLRGDWGFSGCVVSDCGAIDDLYQHHGRAQDAAEAAAAALKAGCDLSCGETYAALGEAWERDLVDDADLDRAASRLLEARFRLGLFDPDADRRARAPSIEVVACEKHRALSREMAIESMVLLKNDGVLPLKAWPRRVAVVGPNADNVDALLGNYNGEPAVAISPLAGIRAAVESAWGQAAELLYAEGCPLIGPAPLPQGVSGSAAPERAPPAPEVEFAAALKAAAGAELIVAVLGHSPRIEGEEGDAFNSDASGDRPKLDLPGRQGALLRALVATGKPLVLALTGGSPIADPGVYAAANAVLQIWYPGEAGGAALAELLSGAANPSGRLPLTIPASVDDLPPFADYAMQGRGYRYATREPLFPFGFGLSYTRFEYTDLELSTPDFPRGGSLRARCRVRNSGGRAGAEVVQAYLRDDETGCRAPRWKLCGFRRLHLEAGEAAAVEFVVDEAALALVGEDGSARLEAGDFTLFVGGSQPDERSRALGSSPVVEARFSLA